MLIFRSRFGNVEGFNFYSNAGLGGQFTPSTASSGSLRVVSSAGTYHFFFDTGSGWVELASAPAWNRPVRLFLIAGNVGAHVSFSTTLGPFRINSGAIDYQPYQLPNTPLRRPGFVASGQFIRGPRP